jgi:hypothetical protein
MDRYYYIQQWHDMGYAAPLGGWDLYDIHHIKPREFEGDNSFYNLIPVPRVCHNQRITPWRRNLNSIGSSTQGRPGKNVRILGRIS